MAEKKVAAMVAGTGFFNKDGDPAAFIRAYCKTGATIKLVREPINPYDSNAIAIRLEVGGWLFGMKSAQIGYLKAPLAARLAPIMDAGIQMLGKVVSFYAPRGKEFPRVSIEIAYATPGK